MATSIRDIAERYLELEGTFSTRDLGNPTSLLEWVRTLRDSAHGWAWLRDDCRWGVADLHAHPAAHIAFGGSFHGGGALWGLPGLSYLGNTDGFAKELKQCPQSLDIMSHSENEFDPMNLAVRALVLEGMEGFGSGTHGIWGWDPSEEHTFENWPHHQSVTHQQMHINWIRRAWEGGLRLMIASTVDNQFIAALWDQFRRIGLLTGSFDSDAANPLDFESAKEQIKFIQFLASLNHTWMEVVLSPDDARRVIGEGKLAIILGIEMDTLSRSQILELVRDHGVRAVIPIHIIDNELGGAAIYENLFNTVNYHLNGSYFEIEADPDIKFKLSTEQLTLNPSLGPGEDLLIPFVDIMPEYGTTSGHRNKLGLSEEGQKLIHDLMVEGVLIDVGHMSSKAIDDVLDLTSGPGYPVISSHTGVQREGADLESERTLTRLQLTKMCANGGMIGFGTGHRDSNDPLGEWKTELRELMGDFPGLNIGIGTDMNGFAPQLGPKQRCNYPLEISPRWPKPEHSAERLSLDEYHDRKMHLDLVGLGHYGMLAEIFSLLAPDDGISKRVFSSASAVVDTWARALERSHHLT